MKRSLKPITIERLVVGRMASNCYLLIHQRTKDAIIIDPGDDAQYIIDKLQSLYGTPRAIIATHGHFDHIMAANELQMIYHIPFLIHKADVFLVKTMQESAKYFLGSNLEVLPPHVSKTIDDKEVLSFRSIRMTVIHVPGHTPGSVSLELRQNHALFVGDTLFADGGLGRTDFRYSRPTDFASSIKRLFSYPDLTPVYPGHGDITTIAKEKLHHVGTIYV
jgi:hydroxyacylglutathione hydrolase